MTRQVTRENFERWNEEMIRRFDPDDYHHHPSPLVRFVERRRVSILLKQLGAEGDHRVLEVGCGAGNILEKVASQHLYGIDISEYILEKANRRLGERATLQKANAEALPFEANLFDRVFCSEVLEHVLDPRAVLTEMHRVVRPNGMVVVSVPNERLINRLKNVLFRAGPLGRLILRQEAGGYQSAQRMDDEWHLHAFSGDMLRELVSDHFVLERLYGVPAQVIPIRLVARLRPR